MTGSPRIHRRRDTAALLVSRTRVGQMSTTSQDLARTQV